MPPSKTQHITHPSLITKLCKEAGVPIGENEERCRPMQPLCYPQKKTTCPVRRNILRRATTVREEREGRDEENQAKVKALDSEDEEVEREPL